MNRQASALFLPYFLLLFGLREAVMALRQGAAAFFVAGGAASAGIYATDEGARRSTKFWAHAYVVPLLPMRLFPPKLTTIAAASRSTRAIASTRLSRSATSRAVP